MFFCEPIPCNESCCCLCLSPMMHLWSSLYLPTENGMTNTPTANLFVKSPLHFGSEWTTERQDMKWLCVQETAFSMKQCESGSPEKSVSCHWSDQSQYHCRHGLCPFKERRHTRSKTTSRRDLCFLRCLWDCMTLERQTKATQTLFLDHDDKKCHMSKESVSVCHSCHFMRLQSLWVQVSTAEKEIKSGIFNKSTLAEGNQRRNKAQRDEGVARRTVQECLFQKELGSKESATTQKL